MAEVSMQQVKELRDRTQAGLNDCKGALVEASGDMEKAVEIILKKGLAKSAKRAGAIATEGVVTALVAKNGNDLGAEPFPGGSATIEATRQALVGKLGENITVRRWERLTVDG